MQSIPYSSPRRPSSLFPKPQDQAKAAKAVIVPLASHLNTRAYFWVQQDPAQRFLALVSADPASVINTTNSQWGW